MAGHSRLKDGVASARLCPAIHDFLDRSAEGVDARVKPGHDES
jgi:peptide/nickel transport system ATP-binding protein